MPIHPFSNIRIDIEDEYRSDLSSILQKIIKDAYNKGVEESQEALLSLLPESHAIEKFRDLAHREISKRYAK